MYMDREMMIAACRKVLPYPISFYDSLSDGSLWNVYNKHVVQGIPINKRSKQAKEANDKARAEEAEQKQQKKNNQEDYHQLTIEEYMQAMQPSKPRIVHNSENGTWWRLNDAGEYDYISDLELQDILEAFGNPYEEETLVEVEEPGMQLTLKRRPLNGGKRY